MSSAAGARGPRARARARARRRAAREPARQTIAQCQWWSWRSRCRYYKRPASSHMVLLLAMTAPPHTQGHAPASPPVVADFTAFERQLFPRWRAQFKSGPGIGDYSYFPGHPTSVYGSTDTLMSLFVLGQLNLTEAEKDDWAATINLFQDAASGLYLAQSFEPHSGPPVLHEHDHEHTTAFALAALTLIDRRPAHALTLMLELQANESAWLPWLANTALACTKGHGGPPRTCPSWDHRSAGVYASLAMTKQITPAFKAFFFGWLDAHADNKTGYSCADSYDIGPVPYSGKPQVGWMTCYAHLSWQYVYENHTWPHAEQMVDAGLLMQNKSTGYICVNPGDQSVPGKESPQCEATCSPSEPCANTGCCGSASPVHPSCHQLDGLWTVARSSHLRNGYRRADVREMCSKFLVASAAVLNNATVLAPRCGKRLVLNSPHVCPEPVLADDCVLCEPH